ncbi:STAS domain-containing protein [Streptomyces sp. NBC_01343]|uniref:STAS domain-containing protein n=1 Tax=Streptomyces sp. NBC_01343 TaxID=2903832 RepID=UPI002E0D95C1|nr:STAS domain-containing protein [Streptomyces sp. NBC_01343]
MITIDVQHRGSSAMVGISGKLDESAGALLQRALDDVTVCERDLMVDLHGLLAMDADGLLHLLELHRRAERLGLRVLVVGWQPQPQQMMAQVAGIPGPGSATGERYALAGFRRLIEQRAQRARDIADFGAGWLPRVEGFGS